MREPDNIRQVLQHRPDFLGFIFYKKSPRFAGNYVEKIREVHIPQQVLKVGVFVNENIGNICQTHETLALDLVQLHGDETVRLCKSLRSRGLKVIKVFSVGPDFDFKIMKPYVDHVNYFLFDTKGVFYGGNARPFDWKLIDNYPYEIPFFLGGGIGIENIIEIRGIKSPFLYAVDVNSKLESAPGHKDPEKLGSFRKKFDKIYDY